METNYENGADALTDETREKIKGLSKAMLRLHKLLLEGEKAVYELNNGRIETPGQYLALVIDDPHFAWLRKLSSLIALLDEAVSLRRTAPEADANALLVEAGILLNFEDADEGFNDKFQTALQRNADAVLIHNEALKFV